MTASEQTEQARTLLAAAKAAQSGQPLLDALLAPPAVETEQPEQPEQPEQAPKMVTAKQSQAQVEVEAVAPEPEPEPEPEPDLPDPVEPNDPASGVRAAPDAGTARPYRVVRPYGRRSPRRVR